MGKLGRWRVIFSLPLASFEDSMPTITASGDANLLYCEIMSIVGALCFHCRCLRIDSLCYPVLQRDSVGILMDEFFA